MGNERMTSLSLSFINLEYKGNGNLKTNTNPLLPFHLQICNLNYYYDKTSCLHSLASTGQFGNHHSFHFLTIICITSEEPYLLCHKCHQYLLNCTYDITDEE